MKNFALLILRACIIAALFGALGPAINLFSEKPLAWVYEPPKEIVVADIKIPLIDEKEAEKLYNDSNTVFLDTRKREDYVKSHVKGALFLSADDVEENFPSVQPMLSEENRIVLYCYGPDCDMAEKVGSFLGRLSYKNLAIMSSGFRAWESANYPTEGSTRSKN